jgi:AhpD family alkylhydroperoxidase
MSLRIDYARVAPDTLKAMYAANAALDTGSIDQTLRRLIELRVSQINGCTYCIWLHSKQARELGEAEDRIGGVESWRDADCYTDAERAAFEWTEAVTRIADGTPPDDQFAALGTYFDDRQIVDITATAANMNGLNRMGISFCLEPPE